MIDIKTKVISEIIKVEGGYVNDPSDSGGATKYGITERVARHHGYKGNMKDLTYDEAFAIYELSFWKKLRLDEVAELSESIAEEVADTAVNMGQKKSISFLQRSLNVLNNRGEYWADLKPDGLLGSRTLFALSEHLQRRGAQGEVVLVRMMNCLQGAFYVTLAEAREKDEKFVYGWMLNRIK